MGTAKSIEAYAVYEKYSSDTEIFILELSNKLNADFCINVFDKNFDIIGIENKLTNYNKINKYDLLITYGEYTFSKKTLELPTYELTIPISYNYERDIQFIFYPNNTVHIAFLTFEHSWGTFIQNLKFESDYELRHEFINRYKILRNEYKSVLHKIGIKNICITTHNYYKIENITDFDTYNKLNFDEILEIAKNEDHLKVFDFLPILNTKNKNDLDNNFWKESDLKIVLVD